MTTQPIYMLTRNPVKFGIAQTAFAVEGVPLIQLDEEAIEIQSRDVVEVATFAAQSAARAHNVPVFKSDVGMYFEGLNGFPGALGKFVQDILDAPAWLRLLDGVADRRVLIAECLALAYPDGRVKTFKGELMGYAATKAQGEGLGVDQILVEYGLDRPVATYTRDEQIEHWRKTTPAPYIALAKHLKSIDV